MEMKGRIVFSSGKAGDYDIWCLDLQTKKVFQLTSGPFNNDCPRWSPDGRRIVFVSNRTGSPELWMMNSDGANQTQVTDTRQWHNTPAWSPDGTSLVFCANYDGNVDIYTLHLETKRLCRITDYPQMDFTPRFSPDGTKIIFTSQRSGNDDIWSWDVVTGRLHQLTSCPQKDFAPGYSPCGRRIAFVREEKGDSSEKNLGHTEQNFELYLMDADGQNQRRLTYSLGVEQHVSWSPDGQCLIYVGARWDKASHRLQVLPLENLKSKNMNYDRSKMEEEISTLPKSIFVWEVFYQDHCISGFLRRLFGPLLDKYREPLKNAARETYPSGYFGTERHPDWTA